MNRRQFLRTTGRYGAAAAVCGGVSSMFPLRAAWAALNPRTVHQQTRLLMGTLVTLTAVTTHSRAEDAFGKTFLAIEHMTGIFDRRLANTALGVLNDAGKLAGVPPELCVVLLKAQELSRISRDAFNPAIAPILDLYAATAKKDGKFAVDPVHMQEALALARPTELTVSSGTVVLSRAGMRLTLDGIAKGYIADRASQTLTECGVKNHMVNAGGDLRISGLSQKKTPWSIGIEHPARDGRLLEATTVTEGGIATSGTYEQFFDAEQKMHHLVSHLTGKSPEIASVTVKAPTAMEADGLATTLAMLPPAEALRVTATYKGAQCLLFTAQGQRYASNGWGQSSF